MVCGIGPMEDWCKEYIAQNHLDSISMFGFVPNAEVKKMIGESDALIFPTQWYEGFPMIILEAYSLGTPVLASDIGNVGNLIEEGVTGYKFQSDSDKDFEKAIRKLQSNPMDRERIKTVFRQKYSAMSNYQILCKIYASILNETRYT
jgi:glycosyltransferase involved in cell wall biosynthesis